VTYHGHVKDELVGRMLKEKCLSGRMKGMERDIEDLQEI
jgi:hypothetical protein